MRGMGKILAAVIALLAVGCVEPESVAPPEHGKVGLNPTYFSETLSLASTGHSTALHTSQVFLVGVSVVTTGTASGSWTLQYSNDNVTWDTFVRTGYSNPANAAGSPQTFSVAVDNWEFAFWRILFTNSSGTGTATIVTQMK